MNFDPIILTIIIVAYLAVIGFLGYLGYKKTKTSSDYLLAGREIHPFIMAISYGATFISTSAIVGFGGIAANMGLSLIWLTVMNIFFGIFIAFAFFGKKVRKMGLNLNAHTFPELLGRRVESRFIQIFAGAVIFIFMPIYTAAVLTGAARILETFLGIDYGICVLVFTILVGGYVIFGGLRGVMYTDALQGTLMFFGMLALLIVTFVKVGGFFNGLESLAGLADQIPEGLKSAGITSWTHAPTWGSPMWFIIFTSLVLGVGIGALSQPQLAVRFMTIKSNKELNKAILIGGIFIIVMTGTSFIVGPLSNVYFAEKYNLISIAYAQGNADSIIPLFINEIMPTWFNYIFLLVIMSAGMSTLSSQFHAIGTAVGRDIFEEGILKGKLKSTTSATLITRVGIVLALIITVIITMNMGVGVIARATAIFFGLMAAAFLAPYVASLYWKRLTRKGSIAGMISGFSTSIFCFLFLHGSEAKVFKIVEFFSDGEKVTLIPGLMSVVDPLVFGLPISIIFTIVVSLLTKVENPAHVKKCFHEM